jgi:short-subunit dehydrogenase
MIELKDKKVLLTGGSRGIGSVIVAHLLNAGAKVAIAARSESALQEVASKLSHKGNEILVVAVDLKDQSQRENLVSTVIKEFGTIDILINNAGLETVGAFTDLNWAEIQDTVEVNFLAPMALTGLILPLMLKNKTGHIINMASMAAKSAAPYEAVYSGTKAGLAGWTRALRLELAGTGVHFSTIFPGFVRELGMFAIFNMTPPKIVGTCTPEQVAKSIMKAIKTKSPEIIVNSTPLKPSFIMNELSPKIGDWIMHASGVVEFQRKKCRKVTTRIKPTKRKRRKLATANKLRFKQRRN